jgi:hypothetical protein
MSDSVYEKSGYEMGSSSGPDLMFVTPSAAPNLDSRDFALTPPTGERYPNPISPITSPPPPSASSSGDILPIPLAISTGMTLPEAINLFLDHTTFPEDAPLLASTRRLAAFATESLSSPSQYNDNLFGLHSEWLTEALALAGAADSSASHCLYKCAKIFYGLFSLVVAGAGAYSGFALSTAGQQGAVQLLGLNPNDIPRIQNAAGEDTPRLDVSGLPLAAQDFVHFVNVCVIWANMTLSGKNAWEAMMALPYFLSFLKKFPRTPRGVLAALFFTLTLAVGGASSIYNLAVGLDKAGIESYADMTLISMITVGFPNIAGNFPINVNSSVTSTAYLLALTDPRLYREAFLREARPLEVLMARLSNPKDRELTVTMLKTVFQIEQLPIFPTFERAWRACDAMTLPQRVKVVTALAQLTQSRGSEESLRQSVANTGALPPRMNRGLERGIAFGMVLFMAVAVIWYYPYVERKMTSFLDDEPAGETFGAMTYLSKFMVLFFGFMAVRYFLSLWGEGYDYVASMAPFSKPEGNQKLQKFGNYAVRAGLGLLVLVLLVCSYSSGLAAARLASKTENDGTEEGLIMGWMFFLFSDFTAGSLNSTALLTSMWRFLIAKYEDVRVFLSKTWPSRFSPYAASWHVRFVANVIGEVSRTPIISPNILFAEAGPGLPAKDKSLFPGELSPLQTLLYRNEVAQQAIEEIKKASPLDATAHELMLQNERIRSAILSIKESVKHPKPMAHSSMGISSLLPSSSSSSSLPSAPSDDDDSDLDVSLSSPSPKTPEALIDDLAKYLKGNTDGVSYAELIGKIEQYIHENTLAAYRILHTGYYEDPLYGALAGEDEKLYLIQAELQHIETRSKSLDTQAWNGGRFQANAASIDEERHYLHLLRQEKLEQKDRLAEERNNRAISIAHRYDGIGEVGGEFSRSMLTPEESINRKIEGMRGGSVGQDAELGDMSAPFLDDRQEETEDSDDDVESGLRDIASRSRRPVNAPERSSSRCWAPFSCR